jgi:dUTP pyrophosphatase
MSEQAAGLDLAAAVDEPRTLKPGERALIPCGFAMALPVGHEAQVRPRSGLAAHHGISVLSAPGTIDADYRGEVKVIVINLGNEPFVVQKGMRIAQMIIAPVLAPEIELVTELDSTKRGQNGLGSTG